jgi:hypothetical protein
MTTPARLGRYEIVRQIGRSMTDVYLVIDTVENRKAALKLIPSSGDAVSRLVLEAERRGAAILRELRELDPRVVEVYETGDLDGYFFVAMQYVEGRDLAEVLQAERTIDPIRAAAIALEICEQLTKFHTWQSAVVHGDIKPSNIHLGPNDTVRLLDFGIAKTLRANCDATVANFGSPSYCSPERLTRSEVDQQSDLWAVGATLYQMLAGAPPYQAENTRKLESLIRSRRPPRALPPRCPAPLRAIAMKALAPNAAQRYRSAREFQADLQTFLENKPVLADVERRRARSATATIETARDYLRRATRTVKKFKRHLRWLGAVAWFLTGMALWIGGTLLFRAWPPRPERVATPQTAPAAAAPVVVTPVATVPEAAASTEPPVAPDATAASATSSSASFPPAATGGPATAPPRPGPGATAAWATAPSSPPGPGAAAAPATAPPPPPGPGATAASATAPSPPPSSSAAAAPATAPPRPGTSATAASATAPSPPPGSSAAAAPATAPPRPGPGATAAPATPSSAPPRPPKKAPKPHRNSKPRRSRRWR